MMAIEARDLMNRKVVTASPDMTASQLVQLLAAADVSAVPVLEAGGRLVGMVSESDILRLFTATSREHRTRWLDMLAEGESLSPQFLRAIQLDKRRIATMMTRIVISVAPATGFQEIAALLDKHHIKRVPVVENGELVGIVSRTDIVRAIARTPSLLTDAS